MDLMIDGVGKADNMQAYFHPQSSLFHLFNLEYFSYPKFLIISQDHREHGSHNRQPQQEAG